MEKEKDSFTRVVNSVREAYTPADPDSVYSTLKWISVLDLFIKAKSDLAHDDVKAAVEIGLEIFHASSLKLYVQIRWGNLLVKIINKNKKKLSCTVQWKPLYDTLVRTHFTRSTGPEGWRIKQRHFETITSLVRSCRRFFPPGSAGEIWSEFSSLLDNPWHNSSFEGAGFLRLFLPTNADNMDFFSQARIEQCFRIWNSVPNSPFWNSQWTAILARIIKNYDVIIWEPFLPIFFTNFLNMFEVPVANGASSYPFTTDVPKNTRFLFSNKTSTPSKSIAKSIVYLLRPGTMAQEHFEKLINLLEQYYHPSNGGRWTYSLERFLLYLVNIFQKRLHHEQQNNNGRRSELFLGRSERFAFVNAVLKLIDRGQYSKNEHLSEAVATATSILSYVEPSIMLPFVASRFFMALETMTATHQLKTAITSVAYSGRSLFFASLSVSMEKCDVASDADSFANLLAIALSNSLVGMDANDPPKTLATMQLIGSIFSSMTTLEDNMDELSPLSTICFSEWLDEFLCRLFSLLLHLEPSVVNEGLHTIAISGTFLVEEGPYYLCMLEILLGRLSPSIYSQALKKISKFVQTNILPGAIAEVGLLCCACVYSNPGEATTHLIESMLSTVTSSLKGSPRRGVGEKETFMTSNSEVAMSPALETAIDYQLKVLSVAISYVGPYLLRCRDQFKEVLSLAFESTSWKVNGGGDHLLRSLLGSLILYYPLEQYRCISHHRDFPLLEKWVSTKDHSAHQPLEGPRWHVPCEDEVGFANELLSLHFLSALDELKKICQDRFHTDPGTEKEHLKVTLLRIDSSLQGVSSCLPDFTPSFLNGKAEDPGSSLFLVAGATGSKVGSSDLRERAAAVIHVACKYLSEEKSDDSILLVLIIRIMDALVNYGSSEYEEWLSHKQSWKLDSAAIIEPSINFITSSHANGKRRPLWALVDKAYMHNTWRASQSSFHLYRTSGNVSPSDHAICLMDDLLSLALHRYETVRLHAGRSLLKLMKRWPTMISKCLLTLTENLANASTPEHAVLGSCSILSTQTVLKQLTTDTRAFTSFILGILKSSHHESMKAQKAITELFVKFNILFSGVSKKLFKSSNSEGQSFADFVSQISHMSFNTDGLHWRYNLMANRVLLLLVMASRSDQHSSDILSESAGHFLKSLKSQLPQTRILAISALNTLLKESSHKVSHGTLAPSSGPSGNAKSSVEEALAQIFQEDGFFNETFNSLSHVHIIGDTESTSLRGNSRNSFIQSAADKSITFFYFDFTASWPRTPSWISLFGGNDTFYSNFARIFKRLIQECGISVLVSYKCALEEFSNAKERSKQCVAAEAFAGALHSDVNGLSEAWESWMKSHLQSMMMSPSVESIPEWACCIRYAVTGRGKHGKRVPLLRPAIIDCLLIPLPETVASSTVVKRYGFLASAFAEISPSEMPQTEITLHKRLMSELLLNLTQSSAQVREAVGVALCVVSSNLSLHMNSAQNHPNVIGNNALKDAPEIMDWSALLSEQAASRAVKIQNTLHSSDVEMLGSAVDHENGSKDDYEEDVKWMETTLHFVIASLKSGRAAFLAGPLVSMLYPVMSLQETSNKDLSTLAKAAFELLKWKIFGKPHLQEVVAVILSSLGDSNWRTRSAALTYLRTFMYRHMFILSLEEKRNIWTKVESLLTDSQVEVREHSAAVLAGLMKGGDEDLAKEFRDRAFLEANTLRTRRKKRDSKFGHSLAFVHGAVLALVACVLSVPYDMPSWLPGHVTLLARFVSEPSPVRSTVTKAIAEFRRTHADTWNFQKSQFTEEQLEVLADTSSSSSYFA